MLFHIVIFYFSWQSGSRLVEPMSSMAAPTSVVSHTFVTKIKESSSSFSLAALALAYMCINFLTLRSAIDFVPLVCRDHRGVFLLLLNWNQSREKKISVVKMRDSLNRHIVSSLIRGRTSLEWAAVKLWKLSVATAASNCQYVTEWKR